MVGSGATVCVVAGCEVGGPGTAGNAPPDTFTRFSATGCARSAGGVPCSLLSDSSEPALSDASDPALSDASDPALSDSSDPALSDASNPALSDASDPALFGAFDPALFDASGPAPSDALGPAAGGAMGSSSSKPSKLHSCAFVSGGFGREVDDVCASLGGTGCGTRSFRDVDSDVGRGVVS